MTITRTEKPDGSTVITMTDTDMEFLQAYAYQEEHGLSTTKAAIKARLKTWRRLADRQEQEGVDAATWIQEI